MTTVWTFALSTGLVLLFAQLVIGWVNRYEGPRTKQKLQHQGPLADLAAFGFVPIADACALDEEARRLPLAYLGQLGGFDVEVAFHWRTGWSRRPYYRVRTFFDLGAAAAGRPDVLAAIRQRSLFFQAGGSGLLHEGYADVRVPIGQAGHPTAARLHEAAVELTKELGKLGLAPLAYRAACARLAAHSV